MRLGQHLRVRKFQNGGKTAEDQAAYAACISQGGTPESCNQAPVNPDTSGTPEGPPPPTDPPANPPANPGAIPGLTNVQSETGSQFEQLAGLSQNPEALAAYLKSEYGLQDPHGEHTGSFETYNPYKEQQLKESYMTGMGQAQTAARGQMADVFAKARQAGARGGFGGTGKALSSMMGKTLSGLESQQQKLSKSYTGGVQGLREDYVGDWLDMVGKLGSMGATFCKPPKIWDGTTCKDPE